MGDLNRRSFLAGTGLTIAASSFGAIDLTKAQSPENSRSFGPIKQIDAGVLSVGYAEVGPANGRPVILLHGWPYDIHSYVDVVPMLAAKGGRGHDVQFPVINLRLRRTQSPSWTH